MASTRKVVMISYETGKTVKKDNKTYPETRLLPVGSAFVDEETGRVNGKFHAIPPNWDGKFLLMNPLVRNSVVTDGAEDDDIPF